MEVPSWVESLLMELTAIIENTDSASVPGSGLAGDFLPWIDSFLVELPILIECLKTNTFPASFLENVMGFSQSFLASLPVWLTAFVILYLACGAATLALRFKAEQCSLDSVGRQIGNALFSWCCLLLLLLLMPLARASRMYLLLLLAAVAATAWTPIGSCIRYLLAYRLRGLPHMIFEVGFGIFVLAVLLLSSYHGQRILCLLIVAAAVMLCAVQAGGALPEDGDIKAAPEKEEEPLQPRR